MVRRLTYYLRSAAANLVQNPVLNLVSTLTIALALLIFGSFLIVQANLEGVLEASSRGLGMSVYLDDSVAGNQLEALRKKVAALEGVADVQVVTKNEALETLKKDLGPQGGLLEGLEENPLPASLELTLTEQMDAPERIEDFAKRMAALEGVTDVSYAWEWAEKLEAFVGFVRSAGLIAGGLLFLIIVFIIGNTMKLTMLSRQDELYIMRLIGATESFIRTPFLVEGAAQGLIGGIVAVLFLRIGWWALVSNIQLPLGLSAVDLTFLSGGQVRFIILAGTITGLIGSFISMGRFLRQ